MLELDALVWGPCFLLGSGVQSSLKQRALTTAQALGNSLVTIKVIPRVEAPPPLRHAQAMKMLFAPSDGSEVRQVRKKLADAGIACAIRKNPIAEGVFGVPPYPELWIEDENQILKALRLLGAKRLRQTTVIFPRL